MQAVAVAPRGIQGLFGAVALTFALLAAGIGVAASWPQSDGQDTTGTFLQADIPNGVTEVRVGNLPVFLHRTGTEIVATSPLALGGDPVIWCPEDGLFVSHLHRSTFRPWGERVGGPSMADLPTYPVRQQWNEVIVDTSRAFGGGRGHIGTDAWSAAERTHVCAWT